MLNNTSGSRQVIKVTLAKIGTQVEVFLELAQPSSVLGLVEAGVGIEDRVRGAPQAATR
jgi:hypothetical protein